MNQWSKVLFLAVVVSSLFFQGFQCGSAESTSAKLYMQRKDWRSAEASLAKEVEKNPANAEAWHMLGQTRMYRGEIYGDMGQIDSMRMMFSSMSDAYAKSQEITKEFDAAINSERLYAWQKAINFGVIHYNKAVSASKDSASMLRGRAVVAYEAAITILPDSVLAYKNAAVALAADGRTEDQIAYLKKARTRKNDPDISAQIKIGRAHV